MPAGYFDRSIFTTNDQNNGDTSDIVKLENIHAGLADQSDANWAYVQSLVPVGAVTPAPPDFLYRQAIINGNFDVWQRGTSFTNPNSSYTADRFKIENIVDSNVKVSRSTDVPNKSAKYSLRAEGFGATGGNGAYSDIRQFVEDYELFAGKTVTLTGYVKCDSGVTVTPYVSDGVTAVPGASISSTVWTQFNLTVTLSAANTQLAVFFRLNRSGIAVASGMNIAQIQLSVGDVALTFQPKSFAEELRLCRRYFQKSFPYTTPPTQNAGRTGAFEIMLPHTIASSPWSGIVILPVAMRVAPTLTFYNPDAANAFMRNLSQNQDCSTTTSDRKTEFSFNILATNAASTTGWAAGSSFMGVHYAADAEI